MPSSRLPSSLESRTTHLVGPADTANAVGSGDLDVLGSPRLLAWMEGATCAALDAHLAPDESSVGTRMSLEHLGASGVGSRVDVAARLVYADGRLVRFEVIAEDGADGRVVGRAEITRVVVDRGRFLARVPGADAT